MSRISNFRHEFQHGSPEARFDLKHALLASYGISQPGTPVVSQINKANIGDSFIAAKEWVENHSDATNSILPSHAFLVALDEEETILFVVFRGTQNFRDVLTDLSAWEQGFGLHAIGSVHSGFKNLIDTVHLDGVRRAIDLLKPSRIVICGHSLGGACAVLFFMKLLTAEIIKIPKRATDSAFPASSSSSQQSDSTAANDYLPTIRLVTFGCPLVGNQQFRDGFSSYYKDYERLQQFMWHFVSTDDTIPRNLANIAIGVLSSFSFGFTGSFFSPLKSLAPSALQKLGQSLVPTYRPFGTYYIFSPARPDEIFQNDDGNPSLVSDFQKLPSEATWENMYTAHLAESYMKYILHILGPQPRHPKPVGPKIQSIIEILNTLNPIVTSAYVSIAPHHSRISLTLTGENLHDIIISETKIANFSCSSFVRQATPDPSAELLMTAQLLAQSPTAGLSTIQVRYLNGSIVSDFSIAPNILPADRLISISASFTDELILPSPQLNVAELNEAFLQRSFALYYLHSLYKHDESAGAHEQLLLSYDHHLRKKLEALFQIIIEDATEISKEYIVPPTPEQRDRYKNLLNETPNLLEQLASKLKSNLQADWGKDSQRLVDLSRALLCSVGSAPLSVTRRADGAYTAGIVGTSVLGAGALAGIGGASIVVLGVISAPIWIPAAAITGSLIALGGSIWAGITLNKKYSAVPLQPEHALRLQTTYSLNLLGFLSILAPEMATRLNSMNSYLSHIILERLIFEELHADPGYLSNFESWNAFLQQHEKFRSFVPETIRNLARFSHLALHFYRLRTLVSDCFIIAVVGSKNAGKSSLISGLIGKDTGVGHERDYENTQISGYLYNPQEYSKPSTSTPLCSSSLLSEEDLLVDEFQPLLAGPSSSENLTLVAKPSKQIILIEVGAPQNLHDKEWKEQLSWIFQISDATIYVMDGANAFIAPLPESFSPHRDHSLYIEPLLLVSHCDHAARDLSQVRVGFSNSRPHLCCLSRSPRFDLPPNCLSFSSTLSFVRKWIAENFSRIHGSPP